MPAAGPAKKGAFGVAKALSWSSIILIFLSGLFLSIVISNSARETLLEKQKEFALLLADNLNQQIYRRFTLPTILGVGYIALEEAEQYNRLDKVVHWSTQGLAMRDIRIYGHDKEISYSTNKELVGKANLAGEAVNNALQGEHSFRIISNVSPLMAIFQVNMPPGSFYLETTYPLTDEGGSLSGEEEPREKYVMGVIFLSQDITKDYETVVRFQWLIISTTLISSLALSAILFIIIRRVDKINALRLEEREKMERELHQNEKLASMGRTVSSIAHEIRNPLGIIKSSAELLLKKSKDENDLTTRIIKAIFDEAQRLSQTVTDFLDYARPKQPKQDDVDLRKVLEQASAFLDSEFKKRNVTLTSNVDRELWVVGDKNLLYRGMYNIISNAVQAMPGGGTLTISASQASENGQAMLALDFQDSGEGFKTEDKQEIDKHLDPFYTTKDQGTGLGLAIVSNILKSHRGRLELANAEAGGARVRMLLPAKPE